MFVCGRFKYEFAKRAYVQEYFTKLKKWIAGFRGREGRVVFESRLPGCDDEWRTTHPVTAPQQPRPNFFKQTHKEVTNNIHNWAFDPYTGCLKNHYLFWKVMRIEKKKGLRHEKYTYFKVHLHICVIYRMSKKSLSILKSIENWEKRV